MGNPVSYTVAGVAAATGLAGAAAAAVITDDDDPSAPSRSPSPPSASPSDDVDVESSKSPSERVLKRRTTNSTPRTVIKRKNAGVVEVAKITKLATFTSGFLGASLAETATLPLDSYGLAPIHPMRTANAQLHAKETLPETALSTSQT